MDRQGAWRALLLVDGERQGPQEHRRQITAMRAAAGPPVG